MTRALDRQVGGSHYVGRAIQPVQMWAANDLDGFTGQCLKYITRWPDKHPDLIIQELEKAIHYAELRLELCSMREPAKPTITMGEFVRANQIPLNEDAMFYALEVWYTSPVLLAHRTGQVFINAVQQFINYLRDNDIRTRDTRA